MSTETEQVYLQNSRELSITVLLLRKRMHLTYESFCILEEKQTEATACHSCKAASAALYYIAGM